MILFPHTRKWYCGFHIYVYICTDLSIIIEWQSCLRKDLNQDSVGLEGLQANAVVHSETRAEIKEARPIHAEYNAIKVAFQLFLS